MLVISAIYFNLFGKPVDSFFYFLLLNLRCGRYLGDRHFYKISFNFKKCYFPKVEGFFPMSSFVQTKHLTSVIAKGEN